MTCDAMLLMDARSVASWPWFDAVLTGLIVLLAWRSLAARALSQAVVLFIAFGLAVALAWARLGALDVALAEAAIGAGLLGVLLVDSMAVFGRGCKPPRRAAGAWTVRFFVLLAMVAAPVLAWAAWAMPAAGGLAAATASEMDRSGVVHPVTAVLLNFRSYDTWLEIGVLLLTLPAVLVATGLSRLQRVNPGSGAGDSMPPDPLVDRLVRLLLPLMIMVSGAVLWLGESRPGGAFQAGVILGAAVILARLADFPILESLPEWLWRLLAVLGFGGFLGFGLLAQASGRAFLEYAPESAAGTIFLLEAACTVSIGLALASFHALLVAGREQAAARVGTATGNLHGNDS